MNGKPEIAVLADVHGNYLALKACLEYARRRGIEHYLFLGDYITDHPYPQRTLELLYDADSRFDCRFIRGNREEYMIGYRANGGKQRDGTPWRDCSAQGALLYCYENLCPRDIDWFESLPVSGSWQIEDAPSIAYCHGSPEKTRARVASDPEELERMASLPEDFLIAGHTHRFRQFWLRGKQIVCAGSVGIPTGSRSKRSGPKAGDQAKISQMMLLHPENGLWRTELLQIPYDWQRAIDNLKTSGLIKRAPVWAAMLRHSVLTGEDPFGSVPALASELYREETGKQADWAHVPEAYWRRAAGEFGIELWE